MSSSGYSLHTGKKGVLQTDLFNILNKKYLRADFGKTSPNEFGLPLQGVHDSVWLAVSCLYPAEFHATHGAIFNKVRPLAEPINNQDNIDLHT